MGCPHYIVLGRVTIKPPRYDKFNSNQREVNMANDKPTVCFVDDDPKELTRFEKAFCKDFNVITGTTYTDTIEKLNKEGHRSPKLWVLDLYFPARGTSNDAEQLHEMSTKFEQFDKARDEFLSYLNDIKQGRVGGLELLAQCQQNHSVPVVMFTRKGTIDDAIACHKAGATAIVRKPMPPKLPKDSKERDQTLEEHDQALDDALYKCKTDLKDCFATHIAQNKHWVKYQARYLAISTFFLGLLIDRMLGWIGL